MTTLTFDTLLNFLKTAGDDTRLKIMCILSQHEYNVGDLADALDLTAPTVSHHLAKLREAGLVNLSIKGNTHFYQLNTAMIEGTKNNLFTPDMMSEMGVRDEDSRRTEYYDAMIERFTHLRQQDPDNIDSLIGLVRYLR